MYRILLYLGVMMIAVSCKVSRDQIKTTETHTTDSTSYVETVRVDTLRIAADSVHIYVPYEVLRRDTIIQVRNRWAQARIEVRDSIVHLTANCDSLERLVLSYERQLLRFQTATAAVKDITVEKTNRLLPWYGWAIGIAVLLLIIILKILLK